MSKSIETKVQCPFWLYEGYKSIVCEGINSKAKELYFITDYDKQSWLKGVCCEDWKTCSRYQAIMKEKYSDNSSYTSGRRGA